MLLVILPLQPLLSCRERHDAVSTTTDRLATFLFLDHFHCIDVPLFDVLDLHDGGRRWSAAALGAARRPLQVKQTVQLDQTLFGVLQGLRYKKKQKKTIGSTLDNA